MDNAVQKSRRSLRLLGFDYSQPRNYFVTICIQGKKQILGTVTDGRMYLSSAGRAVQAAWFDLLKRFPSVELREIVVMPNHLHAILGFTQPIRPAKTGAASSAPTEHRMGAHPKLYYEHIIRSVDEFQRIRKYMLENARRWDADPENV